MAIVKKNISNAAIDGLKLLLLNNQPVKARNALGTAVELFKLDQDDKLKFSRLPKSEQSPSENGDLTNKQYVDGLIASIPAVRLKIVELSAADISNQYIDLDIQANPDSLIIASESRVMLFNGIDFTHSVVGGLSRLSFSGSVAAGQDEALEESEKLYIWSYPASGFQVTGGGGGGNTVLSGAGAPSAALGSVGDFYINTADFSIYGPKAVTGWGSPVSLVGPAGSQGAVGPEGPVGPQGPQGEKGDTGTFDYTLLGQPNGVAPLNAEGKIDTQFYSSIAITDVFVVADIAARDALTVQAGDVAKVIDAGAGQPTTFIYSGTAWVEMETSSEVLSVNSKTGSVVLNTADIAESGATNRYFTPAREAAIESAIEAESEARTLADSSLEARLDALEGTGTGSVTAAKTQAIQYASEGDTTEAQLRQEADEALDARLDILEGDSTVFGSVAKAQADAQAFATSAVAGEAALRVSADEALDARLDVVEGDSSVAGSIAKAQADAQSYADSKVSTEAADRVAADEALDGRLDIIEGDATVEGSVAKAQADAQSYADAAVATEATARESADSALDGRLDVLEGDASVTGSVAKAQADAQAFATAEVASEAAIRLAADNALDGRVTALEGASGGGGASTIDFEVFGDYSIGGSVQSAVIVDFVPVQTSVSDAKLLVNRAGTAGTLQVDVQQSSDGVTWTSLFSTKPSLAFSAGNFAVSTNQVLISGSVSLSAGTRIRMNIDSIQTGNPSGFTLKLIP